MTWGYVRGDRRDEPHDTYAAMQARLAAGYSKLGSEVGAQVAPAGLAWAEALRREPRLDLWADDGQHPGGSGRTWRPACSTRCSRDASPLKAASQPGSSLLRPAFSST